MKAIVCATKARAILIMQELGLDPAEWHPMGLGEAKGGARFERILFLVPPEVVREEGMSDTWRGHVRDYAIHMSTALPPDGRMLFS